MKSFKQWCNEQEEPKMKVGDIIEFVSDVQTDKGPSAGSITGRDGDTVTLRHSDTEEDWKISELKIKEQTKNSEGKTVWLFEGIVDESI